MPVIVVIDIYGTVHWAVKGTSIELMPLLNEKKGHLRDGLLELVATDIALVSRSTDEFYIASWFVFILLCTVSTFMLSSFSWVINDEFFVPIKYFAAFFKIIDGVPELWKKFDLTNAPTYCRLTMTSPLHSDELYFLIFSHSIEARTFAINVCLFFLSFLNL